MARDTNFYYSFLVLPPDKRRAIVGVWDFCRAVDDAVDEAAGTATDTAAAELARWRNELAAAFDGGSPQTRQGRALAPLVTQFHLPRSAFDMLIEGVEMDVGHRRYETFPDLYRVPVSGLRRRSVSSVSRSLATTTHVRGSTRPISVSRCS